MFGMHLKDSKWSKCNLKTEVYKINTSFVVYLNTNFTHRLEKEKSQLKAEVDDLHAQVEHVSKNRVHTSVTFSVWHFASVVVSVSFSVVVLLWFYVLVWSLWMMPNSYLIPETYDATFVMWAFSGYSLKGNILHVCLLWTIFNGESKNTTRRNSMPLNTLTRAMDLNRLHVVYVPEGLVDNCRRTERCWLSAMNKLWF